MNNTTSPQQFGLGIEAEAFIVTPEGKPVHRIDSMPSTMWIRDKVRESIPRLLDAISFEQSSIMLELKSREVSRHFGEVEEDILEVRKDLNNLMAGTGAELAFMPIITAEPVTEFVGAEEDPNSRSQQLIRLWGDRPNGHEMLLATNTASLQFNTSLPFEHLPAEHRMEFMRALHNHFGARFIPLLQLNNPTQDTERRTRFSLAAELLMEVKGPAFEQRGFHAENIVVPPHFDNQRMLERWIMAHSGVHALKDASCKNEHAFTIKVKRDPVWAVESRIFDSIEPQNGRWRRLFDFFHKEVDRCLTRFLTR